MNLRFKNTKFAKNLVTRADESGSVLIVVVSLIALASVLAASAIASAHKSVLLSSVFFKTCFTGYAAEGASARIQWLIANDRRKYPQRALGVNQAGNFEKSGNDEPRFLADGTQRTIDYYGSRLSYRILDMASGIDISGPTAVSNLQYFTNQYDSEMREEYIAFINKFEDYIDNNDLVRLNSIEMEGYKSLGLSPLPRNSDIEFKEEILWIPGALKFFKVNDMGRLSIFRAVPPKNMPRPPLGNNFFATDNSLIKSLLNLTDNEAELVFEAKKKWVEEGRDLSSLLDTGILTRLRSKFSFNESGYYTIEINGNPQKERAAKKLIVSVRISNIFTNPGIRYYEWFLF